VPEPIQNEPRPIFKAIESGNLREVNEIINKDRSVLEKTNENGDTPIFYAISLGKLGIVEAIINEEPLVLEQKNLLEKTPIFHAIELYNGYIVEAIYKKKPLVLEQKNLLGRTPIFHAIALGKLGIVDELILQEPWVLTQKDLAWNTPIDLATTLSIISSGHNKKDVASRVLNKVLERKFRGNINDAMQEDFKELFLKEMILKGIYSGENAPFYFECLEKAFDKITPENTFKEIYKELFENVDKNQPITSKKNEEIEKEKMFVFQSKLKGHSSFFIFHVNKANELTSISYCDGYAIDEGRKIKDSATHINGVTTFHLKTPIGYDNDFAKNFINDNTKDISVAVFHDKFRKKEIIVQGKCIDYSEITHSIPTRAQKRGNCAFKSPSLAARSMAETIDPTMKSVFDIASQKPTGAGYDEYKKFKDDLTKNALDFIIKIKENISSKSDSFSDYLRKKIEDTMKIVGVHNERKLMPITESNSDKSESAGRTGRHAVISAVLSKESPNESLSPRTNKTSPLSTKITDPQITRP